MQLSLKNAKALERSLRRRISASVFSRNVASTFGTQVVSLFLAMANGAIIARWLGPEGKGILAVALLVPGMLGLYFNGGIGVANVYFAGSRRLSVPVLTATSSVFAVLGTIAGGAVFAGMVLTGWLTVLLPGIPLWLLYLAMLGLPIGLLSSYLTGILQGIQRISAINAVNLLQAALWLVLDLLLVVAFPLGVLGAVIASLITGVATLAGLAVLLKPEHGLLAPRWNSAVARSVLSFGLKGQVGNILQFFNYRLDMLLVNYFLGPAGVGIYSVSVRLAEILWYFPNAVGFVIFPKAATDRPESMNKFTPRIVRFTLALSVMGAIALTIVGAPLISVIFSYRFASAYIPMLALLPGAVFLGAGKVLTSDISGRGYPQYNSISSGLALILTIILDLTLIPGHGVLGASIASSIAYTAIFGMAVVFYAKVSRKSNAIPVAAVK